MEHASLESGWPRAGDHIAENERKVGRLSHLHLEPNRRLFCAARESN